MEPIHTLNDSSIKHFSPSTTNITPWSTFSFGTGVAYLIGAVFLGASATINAQYGLTKGGDNEVLSAVFMAVAISASVLLALTPSAFLIGLRRKQWGSAVFSALAFLIAGGYSVTAALGSAAGSRFAATAHSQDVNGTRARAEQAFNRADAALALLPSTRPATALQAKIDGILRDPKTEGCTGAWNGKVTRTKCPEVDELRLELATAKNRASLETKKEAASLALGEAKPTVVTNTDAQALSDFSGALGYSVTVETWNRWLIVLTVLLIELGSGLAFTVGLTLRSEGVSRVPVSRGVSRVSEKPIGKGVNPTAKPVFVEETTKPKCNKGNDDDNNTGTGMKVVSTTARAGVIKLLKAQGGKVQAGQRKWAKDVGVSGARINKVLKDMASAGLIHVNADRMLGTTVSLAGA